MDLENTIFSEISQTKTNTVWYHLYGESKYKWLYQYMQNRNRLKGIENKFMVTKGEMDGRGKN